MLRVAHQPQRAWELRRTQSFLYLTEREPTKAASPYGEKGGEEAGPLPLASMLSVLDVLTL